MTAPATPGSYGTPPAGYRLPGATRLGSVRLQVASLADSVPFYEHVLGLHVTSRDPSAATLGAADGRPLIELRERPGTHPAARRGRLGLYHFAILVPDRASLGRFARHLGELGVRAGAADHLVSEAFYLHDPDGLGIEVYADRPRESWRRAGREIVMATDPPDVSGLLESAGAEPWRGMPAGAVIGHVHLHVGSLAEAASFYAGALGFDLMTESYPGALFLGAGGYHHHVGTNTWSGADATSPAEDEAQLLEWTIELPDEAEVVAVGASLAAGTTGATEHRSGDAGFVAHDPWGTPVRIRAAGAAAQSSVSSS